MQDLKVELQKAILDSIKDFEVSDIEPQIEKPKDQTHGEFSSNIAMALSKSLKRNPLEIAEQIVSNLGVIEMVDKVEIAKPGFINFYISKDYYKSVVEDILLKGDKYGHSEGYKGKTILIEHTSPNPNKEFHLGHLKNNVTGLSISYILEALGAKVFRDCIDNNRGIAIAKLMWGYLKFARKSESTEVDLNYWYEHQNEWLTPQESKKTPGRFIDELYVKGSSDAENEEIDKKIRKLVIDWENEDPKNRALWELTQKWVWEGYRQSLSRVNGWVFDHIWHESDLYKLGKEHVERGLKEGFFKKLEDGAILTNLKDFKLPDTILIKNDGTSLYITQDLELTKRKKEKFNPDELIWIIGPEQSLAMKQMFASCSQLGWASYESFHHIPYGFILVKNKDGTPEKMSSRKGTQYHVNDLIDNAKKEIIAFVKDNELSEEEKDILSEKIAIGAVKYSLLKVNRIQDMVFDFKTSISFEGDSAPYILYTYTRAQSILRQSGQTEHNNKLQFTEEVELSLIKLLNQFEEVIIAAGKEYAPNYVASYIYNLAQEYNKFYNTLPILKAENKSIIEPRVSLTAATAQVLKNGLNLLGISTVEKM